MDQRKRKEDFCKKVDQMIMGKNKRLCNNIADSNDYNSSIRDDDNNNNIISNVNNINSSSDNNQIIVKKWIPNGKIEGICKFGDK